MNIPLLYLLERMGIDADFSAVPSGASVRSVQLADSSLGGGRSPEGGVLYIGSPSFDSAQLFEGLDAPDHQAEAFFLVNAAHRFEMDGATVVAAEFDAYDAFNRAVDVCFRFQGWMEHFGELLEDADNADALMRECSGIFGNAAYMVDSAFKVIAIDDSQLFCDISSIWKHLVEEGYLLYDIVYSMQASRQLEVMSASDGAEVCESEYFNNPFINYNMVSDDVLLGHFFVVGYQKRITPGEISLANHVGRHLSDFVDKFGLSQRRGAPYETFIARLMEDAPLGKDDIVRQIAPWGWRATDTIRAFAVSEKAGGTSLQDILVKQLSHELGMKSIVANGVVLGIANTGKRGASDERAFEASFRVFLGKHRCIAGISDGFEATECNAAFFRQAKAALSCLERRLRAGGVDMVSETRKSPGSCVGVNDSCEEEPFLQFNDCFTESLVWTMRGENLANGFRDGRVSDLLDHDLRNGTEYVRTLEAYLKCERRLNETASRLFVHRNTLLYRIGRIKEMLGDDLESPESRMRLLLSIADLRSGL